MTLIEIIVAVGVASLVFAAALTIFGVVSRSWRRPLEQRREAAYDALEQIRQDLVVCAQSVSTNLATFEVATPSHDPDAPERSVLAFSTGRIPPSDEDFTHFEVGRIRYSVQDSGDGGGRLIRESMTLWGQDALAPFMTNALMEGVQAFDVEALPDSSWTNSWKSSDRTLFPHAVRIRLNWQAGSTSETVSVEVFIPAGNPLPGTPEAGSRHGPGPEAPVPRPDAPPLP